MPRVLRPPPNVNQLQPSSPPFANNTNNNRSNNNSPQLSSNSSVPVSAPRLLPAPPNAQLKPIQPLDKNIGTNGDKNGNGSNANTPSRLSPLPFHDGRRRNHSFSGVFFDRSSAESNDRRYSTILPPSSSVSSPGSAPPPKLSLPSIGASFPAFSNDNAPPAGRRHSITDPSFHAQRRLRPIEPSLLAQSQKLHGMQDPAPPGRRGTVLDLAAAAAHAVSSSTSPKYLDPGPSPLKRRSSFDELSLDGSISSDYPSKRRDSQMSMFSDDRRSSLFNPQLRSQYDADQRRFSYPAGLRAEVSQGERNQDSLKSLAMLSELASASEASSDPKATHQGGRRASMSVVNIATHSDSRQPFPVPPPGASGNTSGGYYQDPFASRRGDTPYSRGPELRVSHKLAERKRRKEMKELFEELRDALPVDKTLKTSKWEILSKAVDYINGLKTDHTNVQAEVEQLRQQVAVLKQGRRMST